MQADEDAKAGGKPPERGSPATLGCFVVILLALVLAAIFLFTQLSSPGV